MKIKMIRVKLDKDAWIPCRGHKSDAGLDLKTPYGFWLCANSKLVVDTGVHVEIPIGYVGLVKSRSSLNTNYGIQCEGVIDSGYTGSIRVCMVNSGSKDVDFENGDKIAQLVIVPCIVDEIQVVESLVKTDRGDNGFGSTGR